MPLLVGADEVSAVVVSVTLLVVSLQKLATVVFGKEVDMQTL